MSIFTIGHEGDYDAALLRGRSGEGAAPVIKRGPYAQPDGNQYYGGYAFETASDAVAYLEKIGKRAEWAVYEMDADWPADVWHGHPNDDFMRLKRDATLLRKVEGHAPPIEMAQSVPAGK